VYGGAGASGTRNRSLEVNVFDELALELKALPCAALHPAEARSAPSIMSCIQCIPVSFGASMLQRAAHSIYTYFSLFV